MSCLLRWALFIGIWGPVRVALVLIVVGHDALMWSTSIVSWREEKRNQLRFARFRRRLTTTSGCGKVSLAVFFSVLFSTLSLDS